MFICPETKGIYRGFAYDAIAISRYNADVMKAWTNRLSAVLPATMSSTGWRVVIEDGCREGEESIYNLVAVLRDYSDLTETQMQELATILQKGASGNREVTLGGTRYYLVCRCRCPELDLVGIVPVDVVNAGMNQLWLRTVQIVTRCFDDCRADHSAGYWRRQAARKDYRDSVPGRAVSKAVPKRGRRFPDAGCKTYKADYISPNMERLLGLTRESVRKISARLALLLPTDSPDRTKNFLEGLAGGEQREWDRSISIRKPGSIAGSIVVCHGQRGRGQTKHFGSV